MNKVEAAANELTPLAAARGMAASITSYSNQSSSTYVTVDGLQIRIADHNGGQTTGASDFYVYLDRNEWLFNSFRFDSFEDAADDVLDAVAAAVDDET